MANVLVQTKYKQCLFEGSEFQVTTDGVLSVHHSLPFKPHTVFAPGEWEAASNYEVEINKDVPGEDMFDEIAVFMQAGNQKVPEQPVEVFSVADSKFIDRTADEVRETYEAFYEDNVPEGVDGFLDTAYVAITGAIHIAGVKKARECWEAIMRANTSKIDGTYGETVTDPGTGKILKPEGWKAPDIKGILERNS